MRKIKSFIFSIHRVVGTIVCLFLLMWFLSGLVLLYYPFPDVSVSQKYAHMDVLSDSLPHINLVLNQISVSQKDFKKIGVRSFQGQDLFNIKTKDSTYTFSYNSDKLIKPITENSITEIVKKWVRDPIIKIDTLYDRDIWIMYSWYVDEMPIYKVFIDDINQHQLYISSKSGEVLQFTTKSSRFWAWIGSIPHKFYIPVLRKNTDLWINTLTAGGITVLITALSGLILGVYVTAKRYKNKKKLGSPYKKRWYKWHHVLGLIFGISLVTFSFSGSMALQRIPQWIIKTHGDYRVSDSKFRGKRLSFDKYVLDYRILKNEYPTIKSIEWSHFRNIPIYNIVVGDSSISIDASSDVVKRLNLSANSIEKAIEKLYPQNSYSIELINRYEEYYSSRKKDLPLPVYKVEVNNADKSWFYVNPKTGDFKYLNKTNRVKKWVFSGLHYLNIKYLIERPILWTILIWTLCIGGIIVTSTGIVLGIRYSKRKLKSRKLKSKKK